MLLRYNFMSPKEQSQTYMYTGQTQINRSYAKNPNATTMIRKSFRTEARSDGGRKVQLFKSEARNRVARVLQADVVAYASISS